MKRNRIFKNPTSKLTPDDVVVDIDNPATFPTLSESAKYTYYPKGEKEFKEMKEPDPTNGSLGYSYLLPDPSSSTSIASMDDNYVTVGSRDNQEISVIINKTIEKISDVSIVESPRMTKLTKNIYPPELMSPAPSPSSPSSASLSHSSALLLPQSPNPPDAIETQPVINIKVEYNEKDLLFNLGIINELNRDDKLSCSDKLFRINDPGYMQGFTRWWSSDDRAKTLEKLNEIIDETFKYIDNTFKHELDIKFRPMSKEARALYENNSEILQKFHIALLNSIKGLEKLKGTYNSDKSMTTGLNLLIEKIRTRTDKINEILKINIA